MRKILGIIGISLAIATVSTLSANAQNNEPIGYAHTISFGAAYGYGAAPLANFGSGVIDINFGTGLNLPKDSYFRTRLQLDIDAISAKAAPAVGATFQYMQHIAAGLYVYPFAGAKFEHHTLSDWAKPNDFCPIAGAGIEYQFTSWIGAFAQGAYEYGFGNKAGIPIAQAGIVFAFGNGGKSAMKNASKEVTKNDRKAAAESAKAAERAAKDAAQRAEAERIAAEKMLKEAAEQAAKEPQTSEPAAKEETAPETKTVEQPVVTENTAAAPQPIATATRINKGTTVSIPFMKDSYQVGGSATAKILSMVPYLMSNPEAKVEIAAYGDKQSEKADAALAAKREKAVRDIITGAGINSDRIIIPEPSKTPAVTAQPGSVAIVTIK